MSGFDPRDATSLEREADDFVAGMLAPVLPAARAASLTDSRPLAGLRIGLPREYFAQGLSADVEQAVRIALDGLVALGAELHDISLPRTQLTIPAYYVIAPAEASSNLSRFDGVRYGHRAEHYTDLRDLYRKSRAEGFGAEVRRRIMVGTYVLSHGYYDAYYLQAQKLRRLIAEDFDAAFAKVDLIAGPVSPTVAWNLGDKGDDPVSSYLADIYTLGASLAGLPGLSMPVGFGAGGRPVGLQLIGPRLAESQLLGVAHRFQLSSDWHLRRPPA
jgi:aspartyl-tRNA(Asn)/glutamyl-tRNA(Gln) amidotransferase subunit A